MQRIRPICLALINAVIVSMCFARVAVALNACTSADIIAQDGTNCPSGTGPCTIKKDFTIANGCTLDFGTRDVTIGNGGKLITGSVTVTIKAGNFTVGGGGMIDARGTGLLPPDDRGGLLIIQTPGAISILRQSSLIGRVLLDGNTAGGDAEFTAGTSITIQGQLTSDALTGTGDGGIIDLVAGTDVTSSSNCTISAIGGFGGSG